MSKKICITKPQEEELLRAINRGDFSLEKIQKTKSSDERFQMVRKYVDDAETAKKVVREIEKRLGSKKEDIVADYMQRTLSSVPAESTKGVLNKFKRMNSLLGAKEEKDFAEELVAHKFGAYITKEEANNFEKLTNELISLKENIPKDADGITQESRQYGVKLIELENAEARVIIDRSDFSFNDYKKLRGQKGAEARANWAKYIGQSSLEASAATRSFLATADVSALLRQLWKVFSSGVGEAVRTGGKKTDKLDVWWSAVKTTIDTVKTTAKYGDERAYDAIRAEVAAHPNSYNGVFDAAQNSYGLRISKEEQFPSSLPSEMHDKFSKRNNLFKISEVAFNATVLKARFDLANITVKAMKDADVNIMDKKYADPMGEFVSAFTGRGGLGPFEQSATFLNKIFFAPKYAASQFSPFFQVAKGLTTGADNKAARFAMNQNLEFMISSATMLIAAETARSFIMGDDADYKAVINPRSNQFGKIEINDRMALDLTGGNRSVVGLFSKLASNRYYDARLGTWREKGLFQQADGKAWYDFASAKYAPVPSIIRDLAKGEHFGGREISASSLATNLLMPITVQNVLEEGIAKEDFSTALIVLASDGLGIGTSDIRFKPQNQEWNALLNTDEKAYWRAVDELWSAVNTKTKELRDSKNFQSLTREQQTKKLETIYNIQLKKVISQSEYKNLSKDKLKEIKDDKGGTPFDRAEDAAKSLVFGDEE